ncbi:MAG TPA: hypothetical protein VJ743_11565 [Albitalea sp.]|nr:hypothetical protein [Albitalea sp.]
MTGFRGILASFAVALLCSQAAVAAGEEAPVATPISLADLGFSLKLPKDEVVAYHGVVSFDSAGTAGGAFLYPAPGIAGLIAAVATHGVLVEAGKNSQKTRMQEEADKVLDPFKDVLAGFSNRDLIQRGMAQLDGKGTRRLLEAGDVAASGWVIEAMPVFRMTQDQSALVLDNTIVVYAADAPSAVRYQNVVRVVSTPRTEAQPQTSWSAEQGKALKDESVDLFAHSLRLALQDIAGEADTAEASNQKTIRYVEGHAPKVERGHLIGETCGRAELRTLRGWIMSVPLRQTAGNALPAASCPATQQHPA